MLVIILYTLLYIRKKQKQSGSSAKAREERTEGKGKAETTEGQKIKKKKEEGRRMPPTSSPCSCPLALFCSPFRLPVPRSSLTPSCRLTAQPSPAAHPVTPSPRREGVHPVRLWVMSSPPPRHHRAADRQPAEQRLRLPDLLPASPLSSPPGRW